MKKLKKPSLNEYIEQQLESKSKVFDLDEYGIKKLGDLKLPEYLEELSLFNNEIIDPNEVANNLVPLTNLKAMWL
eukprot:CAMPEP_0116880092 /NCGR_PEP_ID=MMETSP0463-20121206/11969_1 /TAXON_ID=181622 /ORGANISM="Strombidinopsis sp, Strain SopsisLIS2011" /LENGTH=74 /DNA_ID=CAMNT_0004530221 /DNA_START=417 /DNA_END=640 /DNA_ORIENTATION=-